MGNQKSLYKTYFNEVYLKREDNNKEQSFRPHSGVDNYTLPVLQEQSSTESSRQTPDNVMGRQTNQ